VPCNGLTGDDLPRTPQLWRAQHRRAQQHRHGRIRHPKVQAAQPERLALPTRAPTISSWDQVACKATTAALSTRPDHHILAAKPKKTFSLIVRFCTDNSNLDATHAVDAKFRDASHIPTRNSHTRVRNSRPSGLRWKETSVLKCSQLVSARTGGCAGLDNGPEPTLGAPLLNLEHQAGAELK